VAEISFNVSCVLLVLPQPAKAIDDIRTITDLYMCSSHKVDPRSLTPVV
jgi:hypothetical protein